MRTYPVFGAWFFIFASFFLSSCTSSPSSNYTTTVAEGQAAAKEIMETTWASSISLALIDGEKVVWAETFGLADKASLSAPSADTMYCIGSTSKMVAAIAAMKLVDQGRISLDAPLMNYLTSFSMASPEYTQITTRMLLNHSAGFPGGDYRNSETSTPLPFSFSAQVLETLKTERLKHTPGYLSVYANDGFTIIEQLVAAVTGKSYVQFVQDEIFKPLGMNHSRYPLDYFPNGSFAKRYAGDTPMSQLFLNSFGSGGLYSTPTDMAKLAMMFMGKGKIGNVRILSEASVAAMAVDQTLSNFNPVKAKSYSYGLGWDTVIQPGLGAVGVIGWQKGGAVTLYGSVMTIAPAEGLAVVVMGASNGFGPDSATVIAERILLKALAEKGRIAAMPKPLNLSPRPLKSASAGQLDSASGYYASNDSVMRVQKQSDNSLNIDRYDTAVGLQPWLTGLKLRDNDRFSSDKIPRLSFSIKTADARQYLVISYVTGYGHYQDEIIQGEKIAAPGIPAAWGSRSGKKWLITNDHPDSDAWETPLMQLNSFDNFLVANRAGLHQVVDPTSSDFRANMMLLIPQIYGRDLNDVVIDTTRGGGEWIRFGSFLCRPQETIVALTNGNNAVNIGAEGLAEWRAVDASGVTKTVTISPAARWKLYNSDFEQIEIKTTLSGGTYYLLFHDAAIVDVF